MSRLKKENIKKRENEFMNWLNSKFNINLEMQKNEFSGNDFFNKEYIIELKNRNDSYSTKMIELYKLTANYQKAQLSNRQFIYCVVDANGASIFNISKNIDKILNLKIQNKKMAHTEHFKSKDHIMKVHYNLPKELAEFWELEYNTELL